MLALFSLRLSSSAEGSFREPTVARGKASFAANTVASVVVESVGWGRIPHQVQVLGEASGLAETAVDPAALAAVLGCWLSRSFEGQYLRAAGGTVERSVREATSLCGSLFWSRLAQAPIGTSLRRFVASSRAPSCNLRDQLTPSKLGKRRPKVTSEYESGIYLSIYDPARGGSHWREARSALDAILPALRGRSTQNRGY